MPALAAGLFCKTPLIKTPCGNAPVDLSLAMPKLSAISAVKGRGSTPIQPRVTLPSLIRAAMICVAVETGTAKPMPMLPPERE